MGDLLFDAIGNMVHVVFKSGHSVTGRLEFSTLADWDFVVNCTSFNYSDVLAWYRA